MWRTPLSSGSSRVCGAQQRCNGVERLGERRLLAGEHDGIGRRCEHGAGGNDIDRRGEVPERAFHDEAMPP